MRHEQYDGEQITASVLPKDVFNESMTDTYIYQSIDEVLLHLYSLTLDKRNAMLHVSFKIRNNYLEGNKLTDVVGFYARFLSALCSGLSVGLVVPTIYESGQFYINRVNGNLTDYTSLTTYFLESTLCSFKPENLDSMVVNIVLQVRNNKVVNQEIFPAIATSSILHLLLDSNSKLETIYAREPNQVPPSTIVQ